jgi:hypothetical protein
MTEGLRVGPAHPLQYFSGSYRHQQRLSLCPVTLAEIMGRQQWFPINDRDRSKVPRAEWEADDEPAKRIAHGSVRQHLAPVADEKLNERVEGPFRLRLAQLVIKVRANAPDVAGREVQALLREVAAGAVQASDVDVVLDSWVLAIPGGIEPVELPGNVIDDEQAGRHGSVQRSCQGSLVINPVLTDDGAMPLSA